MVTVAVCSICIEMVKDWIANCMLISCVRSFVYDGRWRRSWSWGLGHRSRRQSVRIHVLPSGCHRFLSHATLHLSLFLLTCFQSGMYAAVTLSRHRFLLETSWNWQIWVWYISNLLRLLFYLQELILYYTFNILCCFYYVLVKFYQETEV